MAVRNQGYHPDLKNGGWRGGYRADPGMLLEAIGSTGSISAAHRKLGISYAHVWKMVAALNELFSPPLVAPIRGGARGGGAVLTQQGHKILNSYRRLEELSQELARTQLLVIRKAISQRDKRLEN